MGAGIAVSYGVLSHDLGLAGHLARRLTALTGRGSTVDVRAYPEITMEDATKIVSAPGLSRYDAIVATLGGITAVTLRPTDAWRADLERFLSAVHANSPDTKVFMVGVPPVSLIVRMPHFFSALVERHTARINAITMEVCARYPAALYVSFEPAPVPVLENINRQLYRSWAETLAWPIADALDAGPLNSADLEGPQAVREVPSHADSEVYRQSALDRMRLIDARADEEIMQVVATVRDLFGASGAALNIIDRARQWVMATVGMSNDELPREESICTKTIHMIDVMIVEDTLEDDRFKSMDWAHGDHPIRFYAGYPIEDPDGYRLGALCVVDTKPRTFTATDEALLRELAMRVQALLWEKSRGTPDTSESTKRASVWLSSRPSHAPVLPQPQA